MALYYSGSSTELKHFRLLILKTAKLDQSDNEEEYEEEDTENPPSSISLFEVLKKIEPEYPLLTLNCRFDSLLTEQMDFKFTIVKRVCKRHSQELRDYVIFQTLPAIIVNL
ncbi:12277_t:CDS:2 [Funneliformis geosporum]|uniref:12277_t:CDS:1 n=1 Tax=Funneliformis geosporum TaxID=1117311 RepID=A0A9W4T2N2_9GLOM|nr:12277_t:CDS:2 [Funneliformis geosporum]